jgi:hypothetical protein
MCLCVCVCMCVCVYVWHAQACKQATRLCVYICTCVCVYLCVCLCVCVWMARTGVVAGNAVVGLGAVLAACFMSGFAGIYFEKVCFRTYPLCNVWMQNVFQRRAS